MKEVIVLSYMDGRKRKVFDYSVGDLIDIPFTGVYNGSSIKKLSVRSTFKFSAPSTRSRCVFKVLVDDCLSGVLIGKLCSIEFL